MTAHRHLVAVTGASGFVGAAFAAAAQKSGYRLRILGRNPQEIGDEFHKLDLEAQQPIDSSLLENCHAVVHLGARIPADQSDPAEARMCFEANALATLRLLQAAEKARVKSFIHSSSANAYAQGVSKADEAAAMFPSQRATYYLTSKFAQEVFAAHWGLHHDIRVVCLRLSSVYGPGQKKGALVSMIGKILRGEKVSLANGGQFGADFVLVVDVVQAILATLQTECDGSFNIGSGHRSTMLDIMSAVGSLCGARADQIEIEEITSAFDDGFPALDVEKAKAAFGFSPTPMRQGMSAFVDYLKNDTQ